MEVWYDPTPDFHLRGRPSRKMEPAPVRTRRRPFGGRKWCKRSALRRDLPAFGTLNEAKNVFYYPEETSDVEEEEPTVALPEKYLAELPKRQPRRPTIESVRRELLDLHRDHLLEGLARIESPHGCLLPTPLTSSVGPFLRQAARDGRLELAFHGTNKRNYPSIFARGLLPAGEETGIAVAHGNSYGRGIYTTSSLQESCHYATGHTVLVCGVIDDSVEDKPYLGHVSRHCGGLYLVAEGPAYAVPLFTLQFRPSRRINGFEQLRTLFSKQDARAVIRGIRRSRSRSFKRLQYARLQERGLSPDEVIAPDFRW